MKQILPVVAAGGTFAGAAVLGLLAGIVAAGRSGKPMLVPAGLLLGALLGGYSAVRILLRSMK